MVENGAFVDPRILSAQHSTEASRKVSDLTPALAVFVTNPIVLSALIFPIYDLYLAAKEMRNYSVQKEQSPKR